jgi:hypothetical protein
MEVAANSAPLTNNSKAKQKSGTNSGGARLAQTATSEGWTNAQVALLYVHHQGQMRLPGLMRQ